jgi:hypothetical protein
VPLLANYLLLLDSLPLLGDNGSHRWGCGADADSA